MPATASGGGNSIESNMCANLSRRADRICSERLRFDARLAAVVGMPFIESRPWPRLLPGIGLPQSRARRSSSARLRGAHRRLSPYGFTLNAADIDLWAVDQFGHGLSPGPRGDFGSIEGSAPRLPTA